MTTPRRSRWLHRDPAPDAGARLFCLPYSGCGASMYRQWPTAVGDLDLCPVQLPGRENRLREPSFGSFEDLASQLAEELLPYLDVPFAFFGHCSSALVAYETTLELARHGYPLPVRVFVSSQVPPHRGAHGRFLEMSTAELEEEVRTLITRLGGTPRPDLVELSLEVLLSDVAAHRRYRPARPAPLPCPVTALGWDQDVEVPHELMADWPDLAETVFRVLPGPHYGFMSAPPQLLSAFLQDMGRPAALTGLPPA
ncbi:thioesterase II family protein [Kitasatospora brasiliensis]|uniref:thioesterase II family protein n=1 Tax=Kitasatospora brasiliensis TaxID=3058040 RepID=UPI002930EE98|nr:thioesterase domain-containing protein [Kitasatospora sp. K002]